MLVALGTVAVGTAGAQIGCGSTISANTTLTADIGPCPGPGLIVVADNVSLNFNGHRVFGTADQGTSPGVAVPRRTGVKISGPGSIYGFDSGIVIGAGSKNTVRGLYIHDNVSSQFVADNPGPGQLGDGILMFSSSFNVIQGNTVARNGPFSGIAVASFTDDAQALTGPPPTGNTIEGNTVRDNNLPELCAEAGTTTEYPGTPCDPFTPVFNQDIGIRIEGPVALRNTVKANLVTGSGRDGIAVLNTTNRTNPPSADNSIIGNTVRGSGFTGFDFEGFFLSGAGILNRCFNSSVPSGCPVRTLIKGNTSDNNSASGILLGTYSTSNTVTGNKAHGNGLPGIGGGAFDRSWDGEDDHVSPPCDNNLWRANDLGTGNLPCVGAKSTQPPVVVSGQAAQGSAAPVGTARASVR
ncbi:MAG: right-handed parallel beta-helix repeat-containing protein [Actinobacteria bacterium]|nr:right-handed parallel beta-helix repeat-containing protein [Actinomycetota bacterium]